MWSTDPGAIQGILLLGLRGVEAYSHWEKTPNCLTPSSTTRSTAWAQKLVPKAEIWRVNYVNIFPFSLLLPSKAPYLITPQSLLEILWKISWFLKHRRIFPMILEEHVLGYRRMGKPPNQSFPFPFSKIHFH